MHFFPAAGFLWRGFFVIFVRITSMLWESVMHISGIANPRIRSQRIANSLERGQEFEEAHKAATLQPVLPDIEQILEDFRIKRGK